MRIVTKSADFTSEQESIEVKVVSLPLINNRIVLLAASIFLSLIKYGELWFCLFGDIFVVFLLFVFLGGLLLLILTLLSKEDNQG